MLRRIEREIPLYEQLGLFTEAPKKKRKPRVISVRPLRSDFTNYVDPEEQYDVDDGENLQDEDYSDYAISIDDIDVSDLDETDMNDIPEEEPDEGEENPDTIDVPDITDDDLEGSGEETEPPTQDIQSEEQPDTPDVASDEPPTEGEEVNTEEPPVEEQNPQGESEPPAEGEQPTEAEPSSDEGGEVIDVDGGGQTEDFTAEVEPAPDDGTDPNAAAVDPNADPNAATDPAQQEPYTKDDMRKFELFNKFIDLQTAITYFIEKLDSFSSDDKRFNMAVKKSNHTFKDLNDMLRDYMILKFQSDSFLQNSFFYEKIRANAMLAVELLNINKIKIEE